MCVNTDICICVAAETDTSRFYTHTHLFTHTHALPAAADAAVGRDEKNLLVLLGVGIGTNFMFVWRDSRYFPLFKSRKWIHGSTKAHLHTREANDPRCAYVSKTRVTASVAGRCGRRGRCLLSLCGKAARAPLEHPSLAQPCPQPRAHPRGAGQNPRQRRKLRVGQETTGARRATPTTFASLYAHFSARLELRCRGLLSIHCNTLPHAATHCHTLQH